MNKAILTFSIDTGMRDAQNLCGRADIIGDDMAMQSKYEYQVVEDNGGGLSLFVFGDGGIDGGKVVFAHHSYEYNNGQLSTDLDNLDAGGDVSQWDGNEDDPQALYDDLDNFETGWQKVAEGFDGVRHVYPKLMGAAAQLEFGVERE